MAVLHNITTWSIGTNDEDLVTSNTQFTKNSSFWTLTGLIQVSNASGTAIAHKQNGGDVVSYGYVSSTAAGSGTQTVKGIVKRLGSPSEGYVYLLAHYGPSVDDWIGALYLHSSATVYLVANVNGSPLGGLPSQAVTGLTSDGMEKLLELRVTGTTTGITAAVYWDDSATPKIAATTVGNAVFTGHGNPGFALRTDATATSCIGLKTFYADDDTSSGPSPLTADQGSFALTGQTAGLFATRLLTADSGSYALTGQDVTLQKDTPGAFTLQVDAGAYSWNGQAALADYALNGGQGSYAITGQDVTFHIGVPQAYSISANQGSYAFTGSNARLDWSGAPVVPNRQAGIYMGMRIGL